MKKSCVLFVIPLTLFSCNNPIPKDIREFLAKINFHAEDVHSGHFTQELYQEINGEEGTNSIDLTFHYNDSKDFGFDVVREYTGSQIKEEEPITKETIKLEYVSENNNYKFTRKINEDVPVTEEIERKDAFAYYYRIFDNGTGTYRNGGLYYGDMISVKANRFYKKYSLNEAKDHLTFEEKNITYQIEGCTLDQTIVIDQKGMLTSLYQYAKSIDVETDFTQVHQTGEYEYF